MKISKKKNICFVIIIIFFSIFGFLLLFYMNFYLSLKENLTEQNNLTNENENNYWLEIQKKNISKNISNVEKKSSGSPVPITDLNILNDKIDKLQDKMKNYPKL